MASKEEVYETVLSAFRGLDSTRSFRDFAQSYTEISLRDWIGIFETSVEREDVDLYEVLLREMQYHTNVFSYSIHHSSSSRALLKLEEAISELGECKKETCSIELGMHETWSYLRILAKVKVSSLSVRIGKGEFDQSQIQPDLFSFKEAIVPSLDTISYIGWDFHKETIDMEMETIVWLMGAVRNIPYESFIISMDLSGCKGYLDRVFDNLGTLFKDQPISVWLTNFEDDDIFATLKKGLASFEILGMKLIIDHPNPLSPQELSNIGTSKTYSLYISGYDEGDEEGLHISGHLHTYEECGLEDEKYHLEDLYGYL